MSSSEKPTNIRNQERGFALVVTLVLMVLLAILSLGLLSLAGIELRTSGTVQHQFLARQNAILAMNLAIGELQKNLGPDQRVSATAALVDPANEGSNPNWIGAWNAEGGFRGWLISGNENIPQPTDSATDVNAAEMPYQPSVKASNDPSSHTGWSLAGAPAALLVGEHSVGADGLTANRFVFAPVVDSKSNPGNHRTLRLVDR